MDVRQPRHDLCKPSQHSLLVEVFARLRVLFNALIKIAVLGVLHHDTQLLFDCGVDVLEGYYVLVLEAAHHLRLPVC